MDDQKQYFDEPDHRYPEQDVVHPPLAQTLEMEHLQHVLGVLSGNTILDFGSRSGRVTMWFLQQGYDVTAVDVSPNSLRDLRRLYAKQRRSSWGSLTTMTHVPSAGAFDAVVGADILHHVEINRYLPKLHRILAPGGSIAFSEPNAWHFPWYVHWLKEKIPWSIEKGVLQCTRHTLTKRMNQAGFQDIRLVGHGLIPTRLLERIPVLCTFNARVLGNLPIVHWFAFRFIVAAKKSI